MEHKFDVPPVSVSCHPTEQLLGIGHLDGSVVLHQYSVNAEKSSLTEKWTKRHKRAVRRVKFSLDGSGLFSITKNRALCLWDVETGKKIRCLRTAHDEPPYSLAVLPATSTKGQQVATADEGGVIRTWDFRASLPQICEFHDQEEVINEMVVSEVQGAWLLSASADGTLAAYNLRARKLFVRSEPMHSDLLSVCTTPNGRTYVGGGDGYIEVFNHGPLLESFCSSD
uniref:Uncharacterized protein n=1 Tax=Plectus sambesii TaxID=2011161 RepID=A0A914X1A8_9BILA